MIEAKKILFQIENNLDAVISQETALGVDLWQILLEQHPADIAALIERLTHEDQVALFKALPRDLSVNVYKNILVEMQALILPELELDHATSILNNMPVDELTDLFDELSDEDLEKYLKLLQKRERTRIISMLNFDPRSAGGRMNSDVITLQKDFTVKKSIGLLQRLGSKNDLVTERLYITNKDHVLVGHITLDKLVLNRPETLLVDIIQKNELHVFVDEDQEDVADQMHHYDLSSVPVVDKQNHFLGVITAQDVVDIIRQEETEDIYKMSGLSPSHSSYFSTPAWTLIVQRSVWLVSLMLLQSLSSLILGGYENMISSYAILTCFMTMLIGTGGNAGNQSATLVIRALTTNEIVSGDALKVLWREFRIAVVIAGLLAAIGFARVYWFCANLVAALAINISLFCIVVTSVVLGSMIPIFLDYLNVDPAHSAAPFLATIMDILGVLIYCFICSKILC